jgi:tetratricopeptide (TPR) repeat protein
MDPTFPESYGQLADSYLSSGNADEAIATILNGISFLQGSPQPDYQVTLAQGYALAGRTDEARSVLSDLLQRSGQEYVPSGFIAEVYEALGDIDQALDWWERAYAERWFEVVFLNLGHDSLRDRPRFQNLLRRMDFPEHSEGE